MAKEEEYNVVGVCTECKSDQPNAYMERSPFNEPSCKYCGGKVTVVFKANRTNSLKQIDRQRGIGHADAPKK